MNRWRPIQIALCLLLAASLHVEGFVQKPAAGLGVLLMAHGGSAAWNDQVQLVGAEVNRTIPTEIALGMADRATLQRGVDALIRRGVTTIVGVPLFVSSHSSVIESTRYLLKLRQDAPADLAMFAGMAGMSHGAEGHDMPSPASTGPTTPVVSAVPIVMAPALDAHPIVADILGDRAAAVSTDPAREALIIVAHGPNSDDDNARWLADMTELKARIAARAPYARITCVTLRDDAEPAVRDQATAELRRDAQSANEAGYRVIVVPLLLSYGGIENSVRQRLDGIQHAFSGRALLPDPRIVSWVLESARRSL